MKKNYLYTFVYFAVLCCLHYNIFAKTTDELPVILKPTPVKDLPVRFKPLPFKPIYLNKVDLYQFDQKAYVFGKITSAFPVLTEQEWKTFSNDPVRFTLTPNKKTAYVGEEIELTLTAELLNISPSALFTFEELREYTLKVVLPSDFIHTGGTYYDFLSDKLDFSNPKKTYTIKGRYLAKPALDDCFKVLRKLNNDVFILKDTECPTITEVDIASISTPAVVDPLRNFREIAAIDLSKIKFQSLITDFSGHTEIINSSPGTIYLNCYRWSNYEITSRLEYQGFLELKNNNGSMFWSIPQPPNGVPFTMCQSYSTLGDMNGVSSYLLSFGNQYTSTVSIYSSANCTGTPLTVLTETYTIDRTSACPTQPASFTITASSTAICAGNSTILEASNNCPSANVIWKKNDVAFNGSRSITVSEAGNYKAECSSPVMTSNTIAISVSSTPPAPTVTFDKNTLTPGEFAQLIASNCSGTILWTGPNNFADVGNQISVNKSGGYNAKCQTNCGGTYYYSSLSATIYISVAPLRVQADKSQIRPEESVTVTAYGCTNGYIKWKINGNLQATTDNPFTFNSSGNYSASCNSWDGSYTSEWVTIFIHQLAANTPTITANKTRAYNNESVTLTATGCTTYYWAIPVRQPNGSYVTPTPYPSSTSGSRTVTGPANYQVACTNQGQIPWASVTVYQIQPGDITITSNKTVANSGEAVELNVAGDCPSTAGIQWKIAGENIWTTRYESKTVYGPGTYEARCIVDDLSYGGWASIRINAPAPGEITISSNKTSAGSNELITMVTNGCTSEVIWTLPNNTEVRGTSILFATGPGTYKARCVRFGINGTPATIVIQTKANDAPRFYATQATASGNQIFQVVAENCPNNYVQWGVPKLDANGNIYYDYANFFPTLIVRGPGTYKVRCTEGNYTSFQDIIVFPNPTDALTIVANKAKALPTETVVLTAYGCPNGTVQWDIGGVLIPGVQFSTTGPGNYKARCIGDPTNNGDYAIASILPNGSIVPTISSTHNTACPGESVTLTAYNSTAPNGCPPGWPMQWQYVRDDKIDYWLNNRNAIENFGENYGEVFETVNDNPIVRTGPRVYYVRCMKPDLTWIGEFKDKSFIVEPVFPEYLRASNNGPALMGATGIRVAVTEVPGTSISYAWTGPGGFTSTTRNPEITGLTEAKSGIYTVTVKKGNPVVCSVTATTNLVVSGCGDIRIKASDPITGQETYVLNYSTNPGNEFEDLGLEVVTSSGMALNNMNFLWTRPDGTTSTSSQLVINKKGVYKVNITVPNTTIGCNANTIIYPLNIERQDWIKKINTTFRDGTQVTVIPIAYQGDKINIKMTDANGNPVANPKYKTFTSRLLVYKQLNGVRKSIKMHLFPTDVYMQTHTKILKSDFTGLALFTDSRTGKFVGGHKYLNGVSISNYDVVGDICCEEMPQVAEVCGTACKYFDGVKMWEDVCIPGDIRINSYEQYETCRNPGWLKQLLFDWGLIRTQTSCATKPCSNYGSTGGSSWYPPGGTLGGSGGGGTDGGVDIPAEINEPPQSYCTGELDIISDVLSSLGKDTPQAGLISFNSVTDTYQITGDFEYFKTIYFLIEDELKRLFPENAANYGSPSNQDLQNAYNKLSDFYNYNDFVACVNNLILNYTTPICYYSGRIELVKTILRTSISSKIRELDKFRNTFGSSYGISIFNTINQIIKDNGLSIDDVLQYSEDGTSVIVGIKGIDIWNKILILNPGASIITISPLVKKIVVGDLEITYTRFSNDTEDGKITYNFTNGGIASTYDFYFLDEDPPNSNYALVNEPTGDTPPLGFEECTSYKLQQYLINCGLKQRIYDDPKYQHLTNAQKDKLFWQASGRVFEDAVRKVYGLGNQRKITLQVGVPNHKPSYVIPDAYQPSGYAIVNTNPSKSKLYAWKYGHLIDAKTTFNPDQTIYYAKSDEYQQISGYIDVLSSMNNCRFYMGPIIISELKIKMNELVNNEFFGTTAYKNAAKSGTAFLNIVTPYGVSLETKILQEAGKQSVIIMHSEAYINLSTGEISLSPAKIKNKAYLPATMPSQKLSDGSHGFLIGNGKLDCRNIN